MKRLSAVSFCMFIAALFLLGSTASATTTTWTGGTSTAWNAVGNWNNGVPNGNNVLLTGAGTNRPANQNINPLSISCLTFDSTTTNAFTVSGSAITLTGTGTTLTVASGAAGHTIAVPLTLSATRTWSQGSANPFTVSGIISGGANGITKSGTGTLIFSGTNGYTGTTTVSAGTLSLGDGAATGNIIPATNLITDNAVLIYNTPSTITHSGVISGTGTFTKSGTGILTLSGTNLYSGTTTVSAGTLSLGDGTKTGLIIPAANLITDNAVLIYNTPSTITHSGVISGTGTFTKSGTGILTLSGVNLYSGTTTVTAGTLSLGSGAATGNIIPATNLITDNSILIYNTASTITHSGVISGTGTFTKSGTGTLTLSGTDTYTGATTVSTGTLSLGDGTKTGNIIPAANLITDNAVLIYNTPSAITHSGVISGTGTFTKSGTGTLTLSGANTYTGATTVSAGELQFNGVNTGTSAKTVSGGTLAGTGTIPGTVTVANAAGSTLRGGTGSGTSGTLTVNGALTFSGPSSSLNITSNGAGLSLVSVGTNTITESSGMTVNLLDSMPAGTYTLISKTNAGLPTTLPTLGTNNSGKTAVFAWVSGRGLTVTLYPVPTVTSVSPIAGPIAGGTSVIITGTGFTGANYTKFGTTANATGAMTVTSDTQITVTSPAHAGGTVDVTVTTPGGTSATSSADHFTYDGVPTVTGISPIAGPTAGGTSVTITGTGFYTANYVKFGTTANATGAMTVTSDTQITVTSPAHAGGTVDVTVTNPSGTSATSSADHFTYVPPPTFTSITPNTGLTTGGTPVTIVGTGFVSGASLGVTIGGNAATGVSVTDATHIAATTPAHAAGAVWVNITNGDGQFVNTTGAYTYVVPSVAITLNQTSIYLPLIAGSTATNQSLGITVSAEAPFTITVADSTGRSTNLGYLGNYTNNAYNPAGPKLASPLGLAGTTNGTTIVSTITPPVSAGGSTLYTGSTAVTNQLLAPNTFSQPVAVTDLHLPTGSTYRIDLVFTITTA